MISRVWYHVFTKLQIPGARETFKYLPVAFVTSSWLGNLVFGNEGPSLVLLTALIVLLLIDRRPIWAGVLVAMILITKIPWALFPLIIIFVFREWRLLIKTVAVTGITYIAMTIGYIAATGLDYGISSYRDYVTFIATAGRHFPWKGQEVAFNTYNNAVYQSIVRYLGFVSWAGLATAVIEISLFAIVGWLIVRAWQANVTRTNKPEVGLLLAFCVYFLSILTLVQIEEVILAGVIFPCLWAFHNRKVEILILPLLLNVFNQIPDLIGMTTNIPWIVLSRNVPLVLIVLLFMLWGCVSLVNHSLQSEIHVNPAIEPTIS